VVVGTQNNSKCFSESQQKNVFWSNLPKAHYWLCSIHFKHTFPSKQLTSINST